MNHLTKTRQGPWSDEQYRQCVDLYLSMNEKTFIVSRALQSHFVNGRAKVRASDFGLTSKFAKSACWCKVAILLSQYCSALETCETECSGFTGRDEKIAKCLVKATMMELSKEFEYLLYVERFIKTMCTKRYKFEVSNGSEMTVRGQFLINIGKEMLKVGQTISEAVTKVVDTVDRFLNFFIDRQIHQIDRSHRFGLILMISHFITGRKVVCMQILGSYECYFGHLWPHK